jgi:hypothetical protein
MQDLYGGHKTANVKRIPYQAARSIMVYGTHLCECVEHGYRLVQLIGLERLTLALLPKQLNQVTKNMFQFDLSGKVARCEGLQAGLPQEPW